MANFLASNKVFLIEHDLSKIYYNWRLITFYHVGVVFAYIDMNQP